MTKLRLALAVGYLIILGSASGAYAGDSLAAPAQGRESRSLAFILDFSTCSAPVNGAYTCDLTDPTGKPAGTITVTFLTLIGSDGLSVTWHENWFYDLNGGTISVDNATAWNVVGAAVPDENGFAPPAVGFGKGEIDSGTGRFQKAAGTITMRWDAEICICLIEFA